MRKCVVWGTGNEYDSILNLIQYEELKGYFKCIAVLSEDLNQFVKKKDGYPVISKEELKEIEFDYLINSVGAAYSQEVKKEALALGIPNSKIISSEVFKIPYFDFKRYASLRENPVTILSDDCWGTYIYHALDLPFTSPLINIFCPPDSFCEFIKDPLFYLEQPVYMVREGDPRNNLYPIGRLDKVELHFWHSANFHKAKELWDRRKNRINKERIFVKFAFNVTEPQKEKYLAAFDQVPYPKICAYSGETNVKDVLYAKRFEWDWYRKEIIPTGHQNYSVWFISLQNILRIIDIFKLLNGERDFIRES